MLVTETLTRKKPSGRVRRMKKLSVIPVVLALALVAAAPVSASTPSAVLKSQLRAQKAKVAKLQGQLAKVKSTDAATITTLNGKILALTGQVTAQAQGGLAAVLAGSPDDLWAATVALWTAFPKRADGVYCGFDKDNSAFTFGTDTSLSYSFRSSPCTP